MIIKVYVILTLDLFSKSANLPMKVIETELLPQGSIMETYYYLSL